MLRGEAKAEQVCLILRDRMLTAAFAFGAKLPKNELAEVQGVSGVTIRLGELARERLIDRRRRASRRVIYRAILAPMIADSFGRVASLAAIGRRTAVTLPSFASVAAGAVAQGLDVPSDQILQRSVHVRSVDDDQRLDHQEQIAGRQCAALREGSTPCLLVNFR